MFSDLPTGPQARMLRRMRGAVLTAVGTDRVLYLLDGHEVSTRLVAGLLKRRLIVAVDGTTEYTLTARGRRWAARTEPAK